jgi:acetyltransferase
MIQGSLAPFFAPRHVVFIGASRTPGRLGYVLAHNLVEHGFRGEVSFVNPNGGALFGRPLHPSLDEVPGSPDLAVLLIPAALIPDALDACGRRGIRAAIVASGGFSETGEAGRELERRIRDVLDRHGMRLVGPNCIGIMDSDSGLDTAFLSGPGLLAGPVAFVSQSGAVCAAVIEWARGDGFGLSRLFSLGNQVDVTETDVLEAIGRDANSTVVTLYLEGVDDGRRFVDVASEVTRRKPVIALKVGRSEAGRRAAASHTGALAGRDVAYDAAFRRAGILRARSSEDVFDWARVLAQGPFGPAHRLAILTNAGGPGVAATDAAAVEGLDVIPLTEATRARLRDFVPPEGAFNNPVDMLAAASPVTYGGALRVLLDADEVDSVLVILPPPPGWPAEDVADAIIAETRGSRKAVVVALMGDAGIRVARERLREAGVPAFRYPERAVRALAAVEAAERARLRPDGSAVPATVGSLPAPGPGGWLDAEDAAGVVSRAGIDVPPMIVAPDPDSAAAAQAALGGPVAVKLRSRSVVHKTDVGGVRLGVDSPAAAADAVSAIRDGVGAEAFDGVLVQPMAGPGFDLIVGAVRDEQFGPLVMVGTGGTDVEAVADAAFDLAPVTREQAAELLDRSGAARRLVARRGQPAADRDAVIDAIVRVAALAAGAPSIREMDINPLRVSSNGAGALALDVRIRVDEAG